MHIAQGGRSNAPQFRRIAPFGTMDLREIGADAPFLRSHDVADVVMPMLRLTLVRPGRNEVTVDVDGDAGGLMPWVEGQPLHARLLESFPQSRSLEAFRRLIMPARLQPACKRAVVDQQDATACFIQNER